MSERLADVNRVARFLELYHVWCRGWGLYKNMNIADEVAREMAEIVRRWDFSVPISDDDDEAEMAIAKIVQAQRRAALRAPGGEG